MSNNVLIFGHKSPDLDSVAGAITYAYLKNYLEETDKYKAVILEDTNKETQYILDKFNFPKPELVSSVEGKEVILVDHNEFSQSAPGIEEAKILEILDHHKVNFAYSEAIPFTVKPWGAACSIITQTFFDNNIDIDRDMAGLLLAAILVDTIITKSPTCTPKDIEIIEKLAAMASIEDWKEFGMEIFKVRSDISDLSDAAIIKNDFKDFNFGEVKFGIGQVETADLSQFTEREDALIEGLKSIKEAEGYHTMILFITDIIKEGSQFLVVSDDLQKVETSLKTKFENNRNFIPGIMSRKKQVAPVLTEAFS